MQRSAIKILFLDVDGVLTDGGLPFGADGEMGKVFNVQDGAAILRWQGDGRDVVVLTGRQSAIVDRRGAELGIHRIRQGVRDKGAACLRELAEMGADRAEAACVGDDLADVAMMRTCSWSAAVANALPQVKRVASYVTRRRGGCGAVAEVVDLLLGRSACQKGSSC